MRGGALLLVFGAIVGGRAETYCESDANDSQIAKDDMLNKTTAMLSALLITTVAYGGDIYKWKDKDGKTHFGDSSFQGKIQNSEKVKLTGTNITAAQRREAEEVAARNKVRAADKPIALPDAVSAVSDASTQTSQTISPSQKKKNECQEAWRMFKESQECFGQYALTNGGVNGLAFQHCVEVRQPAELCD
jgi:hypothetical protein